MNTTNNWIEDGLKILNPRNHPLNDELISNAQKLCQKLHDIQNAFGHPLVVNSGYRTKEEQMKINPKAPNSWHTKFAAVDVADKDEQLWEWLTNVDIEWTQECKKIIATFCWDRAMVSQFDIYLEDRSATPTWVHIQIYPPKSGKRIFKP